MCEIIQFRHMIGIFKTNIATLHDKNRVIDAVSGQFAATDCTLDLEDCDRVLRVICQQLEEEHVVAFVSSLGFRCEVLD